jgi:hypothetical protein
VLFYCIVFAGIMSSMPDSPSISTTDGSIPPGASLGGKSDGSSKGDDGQKYLS